MSSSLKLVLLRSWSAFTINQSPVFSCLLIEVIFSCVFDFFFIYGVRFQVVCFSSLLVFDALVRLLNFLGIFIYIVYFEIHEHVCTKQNFHNKLNTTLYLLVRVLMCIFCVKRFVMNTQRNVTIQFNSAKQGEDGYCLKSYSSIVSEKYKVTTGTHSRATSSSHHHRERQTNTIKQPQKEQVAGRVGTLSQNMWQLR